MPCCIMQMGRKDIFLAPQGLKVGQTVLSGKDADIKPGNALSLRSIPVGTMVHNIEMTPGGGAKLVRSAGAVCPVDGQRRRLCHFQDAFRGNEDDSRRM